MTMVKGGGEGMGNKMKPDAKQTVIMTGRHSRQGTGSLIFIIGALAMEK